MSWPMQLMKKGGGNPLSLDFIGKLGDAICQIGGASLTFRQMLNNEDNGRPINENVGVQSCRQSYGDLQYQLVGPNRMSSLKLPCEINIIKYYGRSYLPQNNTSQTKECSLNESLLYIADKNKFREVLTQRCQFTDFDITAKFNVTTENIGCLNKHRFELIGLTMFHTALIFRQDLFFSLLAELPVEKMANLLSVKAEIPAGMFPFERNGINSESMEPHTLLSLAERLNGVCQKFKKEDISLGEFLKEAVRKIMDVKIVARLFKEMQEPCRSSWAAKKDLDVIIQCIIDNSNQGSAGNAFFSLNHNAAVRDILIFFGVNEFTCDAIRKTMDDKIIQEETAAEVLLRSR
ncbi:MAG: hypothetical protein NTU49_03835 [Gammaproteobacteria bacterium]|nr:hypothetical protein [Gammaproteobacteria bacterium]